MKPTATLASDLTTARLLLRRPQPDDVGAIHAVIAHPGVCRYLPIAPAAHLAITRDYIERCRREATEQGTLTWLLAPVGSSGVCGLIQANTRSEIADIGFLLHPDAWGRGLMAEALVETLSFLARESAVLAARAICDADNLAATRMLMKAGFQVDRALPRFRVHPAWGATPRDCLSHQRLVATPLPQTPDLAPRPGPISVAPR